MKRIDWKHVALTVVAVSSLTTLAYQRIAAQAAAKPVENVPLYLSDHRYDLPATLITAAQIQAHKNKMVADKSPDVPMNMVSMGGAGNKHQAGLSIVYRTKGESQPAYAVHDDVAEVYHVLEGTGTMLLGGKLTDARRRPRSPANGMGISGTVSDGAKEIRISKGDVLIIPAGTPHRFLLADEFTYYTVVRVDFDGVTPLLALK